MIVLRKSPVILGISGSRAVQRRTAIGGMRGRSATRQTINSSIYLYWRRARPGVVFQCIDIAAGLDDDHLRRHFNMLALFWMDDVLAKWLVVSCYLFGFFHSSSTSEEGDFQLCPSRWSEHLIKNTDIRTVPYRCAKKNQIIIFVLHWMVSKCPIATYHHKKGNKNNQCFRSKWAS